MNLDLYLTTDELAHLLRYPGRVQSPNASATKWARKRGILPGDGGKTKLWPRDEVLKAIHRPSRRRRVS